VTKDYKLKVKNLHAFHNTLGNAWTCFFFFHPLINGPKVPSSKAAPFWKELLPVEDHGDNRHTCELALSLSLSVRAYALQY
jgi:hypothetical protein